MNKSVDHRHQQQKFRNYLLLITLSVKFELDLNLDIHQQSNELFFSGFLFSIEDLIIKFLKLNKSGRQMLPHFFLDTIPCIFQKEVLLDILYKHFFYFQMNILILLMILNLFEF